jgi:hypothetical protein
MVREVAVVTIAVVTVVVMEGEVEVMGEVMMGQVGISDDYGSYRNLFEPNKHQLCWAHPQRKLRDLAASDKLTNAKQKHCQSVYRKFSDLYAKVEQAKQGFDEGKKPIDSQIQKFKKTFLSIAKPHPKDPEKLATIKATLTERCDRYFVCLVVPGIPPRQQQGRTGTEEDRTEKKEVIRK